MPDLRQLRAFLAVAEQLSFTRAAEQLHLQQQTVSKTVRQLEDELGVELLERTTREVRLTPAGAALVESGGSVIRAADAAFSRARQVGTGVAGRVRVGLTPAIGPRDREELVGALRETGSELSVALHDVRPGDLRRMLLDHELDLGLIRSTGASDSRLHHAELRPTPAVVCVRSDHRLAGAASVRLDQLDGERVLVPSPRGNAYTEMVLAMFAASGASVIPVEARVTGSTAIAELLVTDVVVLMPIGTVAPEGVVALPAPDVHLPLLLLWPAGMPSPAVHRVRRAMALPG